MGGNAAAVPNTDDSFCATPSARNLDGSSTSQVEPETTRIDDRKDDIDTSLLRRAPSSLGQARYNLDSSFDVAPKDLNFRCQKAKPIHPSFPTVIYLDNNWTEIACGHCGANASYRQNELKLYGGGFAGLYNHFRAAHKDETDVSAGAMVKTCRRRVVSDEDAELMKEGEGACCEDQADHWREKEDTQSRRSGSAPDACRSTPFELRATVPRSQAFVDSNISVVSCYSIK